MYSINPRNLLFFRHRPRQSMIKIVSSFLVGVAMSTAVPAPASATEEAPPTLIDVPEYLKVGITKLISDAGDLYGPQSELMIALAATGHVGKNLHTHRMQMHTTAMRGPVANVHAAKGKVVRSLEEVFKSVEKAHQKILAQIQNPFPSSEILDGLAEASRRIVVSINVLDQLSSHRNPVVAGFYREMSAVLRRALGLKVYLISVLPLLFTEEGFTAVNKLKRDELKANTKLASTVSDGYTSLILLGATDAVLTQTFARVEFDHVWEN